MELIASGNFSCCEMSQKFCSTENFGPGPIFSEKNRSQIQLTRCVQFDGTNCGVLCLKVYIPATS